MLDALVQTILTVWTGYYLLLLVTTHYMAHAISGVFVFLAFYQAVSAGLRLYWKRKTRFNRFLRIYFAGVILVIFLYVYLIVISLESIVFISAIVLPMLLAIYLCVLSWLMSFAKSSELSPALAD
jgi:hypothetical protein